MHSNKKLVYVLYIFTLNFIRTHNPQNQWAFNQ